MADSDKPMFSAHRLFGSILNERRGANDLPIPAKSRTEWRDKSMRYPQNIFPIDKVAASTHRNIYGYVGNIGEIPKIAHTNAPIPPQLFTGISYTEEGVLLAWVDSAP